MKLTIGNMVCNRCIMVVDNILQDVGCLNYEVSVGQIKFLHSLDSAKKQNLQDKLKRVGFDIIENRLEELVNNIKSRLIAYLDMLKSGENRKMSVFITDAVFYDYSYLSEIFSKMENITIEQYFIRLRLDRAKEFLKYSQKSFTEIAYELGFSSPQHFTNQFKQHAGVSPREFRKKNQQLSLLN